MTRPVTTPMATLISRMGPKKWASLRYSSLPVRYQMVWRMATKKLRPMVMGTKRKW